MSDIILFPSSTTGKNKKLIMSTPNCVHNKLYTRDWELTCPTCGSKSKFNSTGMIFRELTFYCQCCGAMHVVKNPGFSR